MDLLKLYIGSSMSELNLKSIYNFDPGRSMKIHINHSDKTFEAAEEARLKGDQERAYILYMRYSDIYQKVRKSKLYKKDANHYSLLLGGKKILVAIDQAEILSKSLRKRYDEMKIINTDKPDGEDLIKERTPLSPKSTNSANKEDIKSDLTKKLPIKNSSPLSNDVKSISAEKLYELLFKNSVTEYKVLMIDIRTTKDFDLSCIRHPNCINISKSILAPGIVCKKIEAQVENSDHLEQWKNRATVDVIVLIDWYASDKRMNDVQDPLRCLNDALIKWEQEIFLKRDPVLLNGGYADWLDFYPQFTTNSKVERPQIKQKNVSSVTSLTDFSYRGLIPQVTNDSNGSEITADETDTEKENWDSAEIIANVNGSKSETDVTTFSNTAGFDSTLKSSIYPTVPGDITFTTGKNESATNGKDVPMLTTIPTSHSTDDNAKKKIPVIDRKTKPSMPSRELKPKQIPEGKDDKPTTSNLDNWPPFSEITTMEKPQPTSNFDAEYAETINRTEANRKRKEDEERKIKDLQERKKLAQAQALEQQMRQEAEKKEMERKMEEKDLANTMRLNKSKKPIIDDHTTNQEPTPTKETTSSVSIDAAEVSKLDHSHPVIRRDNKPVTVIPEKKNVKIDEPKLKDPISSIPNKPVDGAKGIVSSQTPIIPPTKPISELSNHPHQKSIPETPNRQLPKTDVVPPNPTSQKPIAGTPPVNTKLDQPQKPTEKSSAKPNSAYGKKSLIKTDDTKENAKSKPIVKNPPRALPQPKNQEPYSNIERKGSTNLPLNWEKKLDKKTGRYFYLNHKTKTTHWELPNSVREQISKVPLKDDTAPSSGSLKRSSSTPNIAQLVENESQNVIARSKPVVPNRGNKPSAAFESTSAAKAVRDPIDVYTNNLIQLSPEPGGPGPGLCGLRNLGNTCYMNSVLQCMFSTSFLVEYFLNNSYKPYINKENFLGSSGEITEGFALLMKATWEGRYRSLTPKQFRLTISRFNSRFYTYTQQDSQELLLFLLDGLHEDLNEIKDRTYIEEKDDNINIRDEKAAVTAWTNHSRLNKSVIVKLFQGQFKATVQCLSCKTISRKFDVFMYLSLPIPSNGNCSINDCVKKFSEKEKLSGDNKWRCPVCKKERDAERKMEIWKLPPVLLIHFKRFSFSGRWGDKVQTSVKFPEKNFDLNHFVKGPEKRKPYELYSVSHHHGATLDSGHYVASCKSPIDQNWYKYDDHEVSRTSVPQGPSAYILCYTSMKHSLELH